jgi:hypothetical protein
LLPRGRRQRSEAFCSELLPPYSPDLNPTEEASSKIMGMLGTAGARTLVIAAVRQTLSAVRVPAPQSFFAPCGYHLVDRLRCQTR